MNEAIVAKLGTLMALCAAPYLPDPWPCVGSPLAQSADIDKRFTPRRGPLWHLPEGLPESGVPNTNTIRVAVFGSVLRPAYYNLAQNATAGEAYDAAGPDRLAGWQYSGLQRRQSDGSWLVLSFTRYRSEEQKIALKDGDQLAVGHEVY